MAREEEFDPQASYEVQVTEVVKTHGLTIRPKMGGTVTGEIAAKIADKISSYKAL